MARSSHYIPGPCFIDTQSAVRGPQFAVRNPSFKTVYRILRSVMLQGYNKSVLPVKEHSAHFFENVSAIIHAGLRLPLAFKTFPLKTARRRHGTLVHFKTTAIFFAVARLPVLPSPSINRYFWSVGNFVFQKYENQKAIFILDLTSSNTVSCRICYT